MEDWPIVLTASLAEAGDKTQLATLLFATDQRLGKAGVLCAASGALLLSTLPAVVLGGRLPYYIAPHIVKLVAGIGFIGIEERGQERGQIFG